MASTLTQYQGQPAMIGDGAGFLRGTVSGNGSTGVTGAAPRIDLAPPNSPSSGNIPPVSTGARSSFYLCLHDIETGLYDFLLQDDFVDIVPLPSASSRIRWSPGYVLLPVSTTTGDGVVLVNNSPNSKPLQVIVVISGGSATVASWVNTAGTLTLTCGSTCPIQTVVNYINTHNTTTTVTTWRAYGVGVLTDVMTGSAATVGLFTGPNLNGIALSNATAFLPSTTAGSGLEFTALTAGTPGNGIQIIATGNGGLTVAIVDDVITITLATSGGSNTNALVAAAVLAAQVSAGIYLVSVQIVGTASDQILATQTTTAGGGNVHATLVGQVDPQACLHNGLVRPVQQLQTLTPSSLTYFHFKVLYSEGGVATDQAGYGTLFIPSTTRGDGIMITSGASAPTAATATIASTTAGSGVVFTAVALGAQGNQIGVILNGPYAGYFLPSTTSGSGVQFTAYGVGPLYTAVTIFTTAPSGATTFVTVQPGGNAITIQPKTGETNTGIVAAVQANAQASLLVTVATVGTASDVVGAAGNAKPVALSGGNGNASSAVTISVAPNGQWSPQAGPGQTISIQFGAGTTNAQLITAYNLVTAATAVATIAEKGGSTTTDPIVTTPLTFLTGGASPVDTTIQVAGPITTTLSTAVTLDGSGDAATITVASTVGFTNPGVTSGSFTFVDSTGATETISFTGSTSTTFTTCSGGTDNMVIPVGTVFSAGPCSAKQTGTNVLVSLGSTNTNNTCQKICDVINESNTASTPLVVATPLSSTSDVTVAGLIVPQTRLVLADLIQFLCVLKDQSNSLP